jgi:hypothetical protein
MPGVVAMDRMEGQRRRLYGGKDEGLAVKARVVGCSGRPFKRVGIIAYNPCAGKPLMSTAGYRLECWRFLVFA